MIIQSLQSLWAENVGWDDQIQDCSGESIWYKKLNEIKNVAIPRWTGHDYKNKHYIEFLIFCDASSVAYGVVTYIKVTNSENKEIKL